MSSVGAVILDLDGTLLHSNDAHAQAFVEAALRKTGVPAEQVMMLGDTPYDVEAAARAGIRLIALRTGGWSDSDLHGAVAIYDDPRDLLEHYEASPLG